MIMYIILTFQNGIYYYIDRLSCILAKGTYVVGKVGRQKHNNCKLLLWARGNGELKELILVAVLTAV